MLLLTSLAQALPAPLHRLGLRGAHTVRRLIWKVRRPVVEGVRVLVFDPSGAVLLVRHSYGSDAWMPPGGGVTPGEDVLEAARRELREETACRLKSARHHVVTQENLHGATNRVHIVLGTTCDHPVPDAREIVETRFFALDQLPEAMPRGLAARVRCWAQEDEGG
ncbi:NUDIX domain-containing protein [Novosphingobium mangrovi (ex Hu et al. 2023)]|uniref:NUDIX domain-containing protein n=1 Tax=Novosphingobium mangrovi (ex Hu et al. 2023) TaxID=2930094 RepID=A0ABT0AC66_9SPHN|nr:NUDIX domain-containing protein [Novosphingobium mangrovi (ex Hu et al. 2023)]MCJ1960796.1 NUDIX domain-containing protein [Novosphingobium mangrovi (ex Hu et al. 2023)]